MRVMFAGTPAVAVPALHALHASDHDVRGVLTRPPAPVGRKRVLTRSPVHLAADDLGLPVITEEPNSADVLAFLDDVDCVAVVAYGALIGEPALSRPRLGWINLHFSLLPAWRGAAPVQHAIMAGEETTGISVFQIESGLDTGPVFCSQTVTIHPRETAGDLLERLASLGAPALVHALDEIRAGTAAAVPQQGKVTLAPSLHSSDARIDWTLPAQQVLAKIRGVTPAPGAWTRSTGGERFKIGPARLTDRAPLPAGAVRPGPGDVLVGTGTAPVALEQLAPPGKPWMAATEWARGLRGADIRFEVKQ